MVTNAKTERGAGHVWYVRRPKAEQHTVLFIRNKRMKRWTCNCEDFFFRKFAQGRHCTHIKEVRLLVELGHRTGGN